MTLPIVAANARETRALPRILQRIEFNCGDKRPIRRTRQIRVGYDPGVIHASTHTRKHQWPLKTQRTAKVTIPDAGEAFHTYTMEWDADEIRMYVDDRHYFTSRKEGGDWTSWPFFRPFHLVLNVAVGGNWGGEKGIDDRIWPQRMEVDYVRVYRRAAP